MPSTAPTLIRLADYRPPEFLIDDVALSFRPAAAETQVTEVTKATDKDHKIFFI